MTAVLTPKSLLRITVVLLAVYAGLDVFMTLGDFGPWPATPLRYFIFSFFAMEIWMLARLRSIGPDTEEKAKSMLVLTGMASHFFISLLLVLVYYFVLFDGNDIEVFIALSAYLLSLVVYVIAAMRIP